jgi:Fe-S-cluster containining protein
MERLKSLRYDPEQRFSCARCTRCCRHFDVALTAAEAEALRRPAVARLWSAEAGAATLDDASELDPLEARGPLARIRRRADGACGFLAADGACRIHAEHGAARKPIACRLFPLSLHASEGAPLVTASFSCPSVAMNAGAPLTSQIGEIQALGKEWRRSFPEAASPLRFTADKPLTGAVVGEMRQALMGLLQRRTPDGRRDLRLNTARLCALLDDWTRQRVLRLPADDFAEYVRLTGRFAVTSDKPVAPQLPSRVGRLLLRGFLLAVVAARLQAEVPRRGLRLRVRTLRVALHLHGLWAPAEGVDRRAVRRVRVGLDEPAIEALVYHFLRSALETLPTGRRPLLDELCFAYATLQAALQLAAMRAGRAGRVTVAAEDLLAGITEAADLAQTAGHGVLERFLRTLTGGLDAARAFAHGNACRDHSYRLQSER